jgi:hypothetical protein
MDKFIYGASEGLCGVLQKVGLDQLAYSIGFKGENILGQPIVICGAQESSYWVGIVVWTIGLYMLVSIFSGVFSKADQKKG